MYYSFLFLDRWYFNYPHLSPFHSTVSSISPLSHFAVYVSAKQVTRTGSAIKVFQHFYLISVLIIWTVVMIPPGRSTSLLCSTQNMCLVCFWQNVPQATQSRSSQAGSQTQDFCHFQFRHRESGKKLAESGSCFTFQNRQKKKQINYVAYSQMVDAQKSKKSYEINRIWANQENQAVTKLWF